MIPWLSSGCCRRKRRKQRETLLDVLKKQNEDLVFLRNQSGQMLNKLKGQEKELKSQRETIKEILWWVSWVSRPPPPPQPIIQDAEANASPMYVFITNNRKSIFECECHIAKHPHPRSPCSGAVCPVLLAKAPHSHRPPPLVTCSIMDIMIWVPRWWRGMGFRTMPRDLHSKHNIL